MTIASTVDSPPESHGTAAPAWLLLHGWGLNLRVFDGVAASLVAHGATVHRADLPGHGHSPFDEAAASFDAQVDALLATLPPRAIVAGWSLGGQFALELARRAPDRVQGLVLLASTPRFIASKDWSAGMKPVFLDAFATQLATRWREVLEEFLSLQVRGSRDAAGVLHSLHAALEARGQPDPRALVAGLGFLRDNDLRAGVRDIRCPSLLIRGLHDRITPTAASAWLADAMPDARHVDLPRAGHAPFLSHPTETLEQLEDFAARIGAHGTGVAAAEARA